MPKPASPPRSEAPRGRARFAVDESAGPLGAEALQDARDCAAFDRYMTALLTAPVESLTSAQRRQRAEVELLTPPNPGVDAALEKLRAARPTPPPRPSPVVLAMLAAWQQEMVLDVATSGAASATPTTQRPAG
ncbi:hypothetical protein [Parafrankia sp. FMc2]|uniref:hypothetical protein n=1 Tax=Parafrankia sp. FMc2 TaxID=3233196 RepID=UPI0034D65417